jgi:hypothetical protein
MLVLCLCCCSLHALRPVEQLHDRSFSCVHVGQVLITQADQSHSVALLQLCVLSVNATCMQLVYRQPNAPLLLSLHFGCDTR